MSPTLDEVVKLAKALGPEQQDMLIYRLRLERMLEQTQPDSAQAEESIPDEWALKRGAEFIEYYRNPTRDELIAELQAKRVAGQFDHVESLYGKFANPDVPDVSEEEFHAQMHALATEWEQELDDFSATSD
ncbi:MAG: hypothetical protein SF123_01195 [Chloroflexota bacterium]|nr:hypothetical protein [Chloroflexota bacterium]